MSSVGRWVGSEGAAGQQSLRQHNLALVADAVFTAASPPSRAEVASRTGLAKGTVSTLVDQLVEARLVRELASVSPQRAGRPAVPLAPGSRSVVGMGLEVNVGYVGLRVLDLGGDVVAERIETGAFRGSDPATVLRALGRRARAVRDDVRRQGMVLAGARLALPGLVDRNRDRLQVAPNLGWSDVDPLPLLGLRDVHVEVANEAKLAGLAQLPARAGTEVEAALGRTFLYLSADVGIGSAIVIDGRLYLGEHGWNGEIGHVVVNPNGPRCGCGNRGCLEQYAGKEALLRAAGLPVDAEVVELVEAVRRGDPAARRAVRAGGLSLGQALANFVNLLDIDTVVLGGIFTDLLPLVDTQVRTMLERHVLASRWAKVEARPAVVRDHAALTGGAREVLREVVASPGAWLTGGGAAARGDPVRRTGGATV